MKKYTWLLFDADGTLLDFAQAEHVALRETLAEFGITADPEIISVYSAINDAIWKQIETGDFDRDQLNHVRFSRLAERYGFTYDSDYVGECYFARMAKQRQLIPGALELCQDLRAAYSMAIVTNGTGFIQHSRLDNTPLLACMDHLFISQEVGAEKPSPAFFDTVEAAIPQFDRSRALVIGDSLTSDIAGGIAAGIDTCWYNPAQKSAPAGCRPTYTVGSYAELRELLQI